MYVPCNDVYMLSRLIKHQAIIYIIINARHFLILCTERDTKTTFYQCQWLLGLSIGFSTKSSRQSILEPKTGIPPGHPGTLKTIVCQTTPLAKLPPGGGGGFLFIYEKIIKNSNDYLIRAHVIRFHVT